MLLTRLLSRWFSLNTANECVQCKSKAINSMRMWTYSSMDACMQKVLINLQTRSTVAHLMMQHHWTIKCSMAFGCNDNNFFASLSLIFSHVCVDIAIGCAMFFSCSLKCNSQEKKRQTNTQRKSRVASL